MLSFPTAFLLPCLFLSFFSCSTFEQRRCRRKHSEECVRCRRGRVFDRVGGPSSGLFLRLKVSDSCLFEYNLFVVLFCVVTSFSFVFCGTSSDR